MNVHSQCMHNGRILRLLPVRRRPPARLYSTTGDVFRNGREARRPAHMHRRSAAAAWECSTGLAGSTRAMRSTLDAVDCSMRSTVDAIDLTRADDERNVNPFVSGDL